MRAYLLLLGLCCIVSCSGTRGGLIGSGMDGGSSADARAERRESDDAATDVATMDRTSDHGSSDDVVTSSDSSSTDATPDSGGGACASGTCSAGLSCCHSVCVDPYNDPLNCGRCGHECPATTKMCLNGHCVVPTCAPACGDGETCCQIEEPVVHAPECVKGPTCPVGCPVCP